MSSQSPLRVMALHALLYCERLFYLEEVEELYVADSRVYAGRSLHEDLRTQEEEKGEWTSRELASETLNLTGKVDCLRKRNGVLIPYEHKRGRAYKLDKTYYGWNSDLVQLGAYALMLEEEEKRIIPEGRIRYHADNVTVRVPIDDALRSRVMKAIERAEELRTSTDRPPVAENEKLCISCSLAPICLPEEERAAQNPDWETIRLFPALTEKKVIHIQSQAQIGRTGEQLKIKYTDGTSKVYPINDIESVVIHGYAQTTTQAIHLCSHFSIPIHWISGGGYYVTSTRLGRSHVQKSIRQYKALTTAGICLRLAQKTVMAKVEGALRYILRSTRSSSAREQLKIQSAIKTIRSSLKSISKVENMEGLRGYEGIAGKAYLSSLFSLIKEDLPKELTTTNRSRRPPKDRVNAILSFLYSLLYQKVYQAIIAVGLEPSFGFFHTPRSAAHPLVMDLMELFRVSLCDMITIGSLNRRQWQPQDDFNVSPGKVWLSASGKKKAITLFENRLNDTWKHPVVRYSLSYDRLIELEVRLLEKEWSNQPGLYAQMRLR